MAELPTTFTFTFCSMSTLALVVVAVVCVGRIVVAVPKVVDPGYGYLPSNIPPERHLFHSASTYPPPVTTCSLITRDVIVTSTEVNPIRVYATVTRYLLTTVVKVSGWRREYCSTTNNSSPYHPPLLFFRSDTFASYRYFHNYIGPI